MKRLLTGVFLSLAPMVVMTAEVASASDTALAPELSLDELKKLVSTKGATIIDANGVDMYNGGHIPGAVSFAKNENNLGSVLPKDKGALIVAYCGGPMCTAWQEAAKTAKKLGYTNIKHFKGGIKNWKESGQAVEKS